MPNGCLPYFDIRKDLCTAGIRIVLNGRAEPFWIACSGPVRWMAPILCFTAEEAWLCHPTEDGSVHLLRLISYRKNGDDTLAARWAQVARVG